MNVNANNQKGFTLLEILLVVTILAIFATISRDFYANYVKGIGLESNQKIIISSLKLARDKAMNGLEDRNWGVHFVNGSKDYYEIFSSPTSYADGARKTIETDYLSNNIVYFSPIEGVNKDVVFNKINATTTAETIIISADNIQKAISISTQGNIE